MDFMQLRGKTVLVVGFANRKSVAWHVAQSLMQAGSKVVFSVRSESRRESLLKILPDAEVYLCDVEREEEIVRLRSSVMERRSKIDGLVHSIAFADYEGGIKPFHETGRQAFVRSMEISCFSLIALARAFATDFTGNASVVAISISTTRMASESYGFMAPIKAALDSSIVFLAKSFSTFSRVRFNAVAAGLLKTSASASIPGYVDAYLYAEQVTLRKEALRTEEVASVVTFLLSPRASGINAQQIIVDAGMEVNYFDRELIDRFHRAPDAVKKSDDGAGHRSAGG